MKRCGERSLLLCVLFLCAMPALVAAGGGGTTAGSKVGGRFVVIKNISPAPSGLVPGLVAIPTVEVGDSGNAATNYVSGGANFTVGSVATPFRIGVHEVSVSQYATFLNAVAAVTNAANSSVVASIYPAGLMGSPANVSGIARSGAGTSVAPFVYSPTGNANHPIAYVSWFSAARFANWMHNGATNGADTENGAYTLGGQTNNATGIVRNAGARWWIPSEDEWFKAAYYKGGGVAAGYHRFPTRSDSDPRNNDPTATNQANSRRFGQTYCVTQTNTFDPAQNYLTPCGFFTNSPGPYGTFDQGGNLSEWTDTAVQTSFGNERATRGGSWNTGGLNNDAAQSLSMPQNALNTIGFRLASSATATGGGGLNNSIELAIVPRTNQLQLARPDGLVSLSLPPGQFTLFARAVHSDPSQVGPQTNFTHSTGTNFFTLLSVLVTNNAILFSSVSPEPTLDSIADITVLEDSDLRTVPLSGIAAIGMAGLLPSELRVTASSSRPGLVNPVVTYQSPNSTGSLAFRPTANANGNAVITVTVENGGPDQSLATTDDNRRFVRQFRVTVTPVNDPPTLNLLQNRTLPRNATQQTVNLVGVSAGGGENQRLRITAASSNTSLVSNPEVTYTSPQATGSLRLTRLSTQPGNVTVTVTVEDGGHDSNLATTGDNASFSRTFTVGLL